MNAWETFAPHALYLVGGVGTLWMRGCLSTTLPRFAECLALGTAYSAAFFSLAGLLPLSRFLRAKPSPDWRDAVCHAEVAIVLGFGYEQTATGQMQPGTANRALLTWALAHTTAPTLLVQEGVWVAACSAETTSCVVEGRTLRRIHLHDPAHYINTLSTAARAMEVITQLGAKTVVLIAHDQQLSRAAADFERVKQMRPAWRALHFVIPEIPPMPYAPRSVHFQTRNSLFWRLAELFIARPRDFLSRISDS